MVQGPAHSRQLRKPAYHHACLRANRSGACPCCGLTRKEILWRGCRQSAQRPNCGHPRQSDQRKQRLTEPLKNMVLSTWSSPCAHWISITTAQPVEEMRETDGLGMLVACQDQTENWASAAWPSAHVLERRVPPRLSVAITRRCRLPIGVPQISSRVP
jgi:hypothetical protein